MKGDVKDKDLIIQLQGQKLLVVKQGAPTRVFTFVHVVEPEGSALHAVHFGGANKRLADWTITQPYLDHINPARPNEDGATWELVVCASRGSSVSQVSVKS